MNTDVYVEFHCHYVIRFCDWDAIGRVDFLQRVFIARNADRSNI